MAATIAPGWLKSARLKGLDQLGIQIISIALYGDLLPGLTNVTDRIRYYSFFPWILHRYAADIGSASLTKWQDHLRRAEFLLALVGRVHHRDDREGGEACVGADQAKEALNEIASKPKKLWNLSRWSAVANAGEAGSYFKNRNGGFGQYYRGQLASLGLINLVDESPGVKLATDKGIEIAKICDAQGGRDEFWDAVVEDRISFEKIVSFGNVMCPCAVGQYDQERDFLVHLLFGPDSRSPDPTFSRARSLRLLLSALDQATGLEDPVDHFREVAYHRHARDGKVFRAPTELDDVFYKWSVYETGEYVHYALEVGLDAVLKYLMAIDYRETDAGQFVTTTAKEALRITSASLGLGTRKASWCDRSLGDITEEARARQKTLDAWNDDAWSASNLILGIDGEPPLVRLARAFACLVSIYARGHFPEKPFDLFVSLDPLRFDRHRVSLATIRKYISNKMESNAAEVLAELLKNYVVGQHLRVAMRKLRHESQSTFKLAIEDGHFVWLENFEPTFTNPRLRQAFRFLRDLGLCSGAHDGWKLSKAGRVQLRQANAN